MSRQIRRQRRGGSLLELVAASTIIAVALVPSLRMMRDAVRISRETETANLMATFAVSKLEEHLVLTAGNWNTSDTSGDFSAENYPDVLFTVVRTDEGVGTGLMSLTATVWDDRDDSGEWEAGEPRSVFATKVAKCASYEQEAS